MKKYFLYIMVILNTFSLNSLNLKGIDKWITNFPTDHKLFLEYNIKDFIIEESGVLIVLNKDDTTLKISIINPLTVDDFTRKVSLIEKNILDKTLLNTDKWNIGIKEVEINFGIKDDALITLKIDKFQIEINDTTILELKNKLKDNPFFIYNFRSNTVTISINLEDIASKSGDRDNFSGWNVYLNQLIKWFENGLMLNDKKTMSLILETKIMSKSESEKEKELLFAKSKKISKWIGLNIDYIVPNFISGEFDGVYLNPFSYNVFQVSSSFSFREIGGKDWVVKPFQISINPGWYLELNAGYFSRKKSGEFDDYEENGSFLIATGPSAGFSFSAMIPKIKEGRQIGNIFGIGIELLTTLNIPYFSADYYYEYFFNQYIIFLVHLIPDYKIKPDVFIGLNLAIANTDYDESKSSAAISKFGFTLGARLNIDLYNFNK